MIIILLRPSPSENMYRTWLTAVRSIVLKQITNNWKLAVYDYIRDVDNTDITTRQEILLLGADVYQELFPHVFTSLPIIKIIIRRKAILSLKAEYFVMRYLARYFPYVRAG